MRAILALATLLAVALCLFALVAPAEAGSPYGRAVFAAGHGRPVFAAGYGHRGFFASRPVFSGYSPFFGVAQAPYVPAVATPILSAPVPLILTCLPLLDTPFRWLLPGWQATRRIRSCSACGLSRRLLSLTRMKQCSNR